MSTTQSQSQVETMVSPNNHSVEKEDVVALVYRKIQLRLAEAVAAAAERRKSTASTHQRASTRKRSPANQAASTLHRQHTYIATYFTTPYHRSATRKRPVTAQSRKPLPILHYKGLLNKKRASSVAKKRKKECSANGCTNQAKRGGVCKRHGAKITHKQCSSEGCTNKAVEGGVCIRHGAKVTVKLCSSEGCTNCAVKGGVCVKHGAKVKRCSSVGCTNQAKRGGVCKRHGAYRTQDESTAFGSELEKTTTTETQTNQGAAGAASRGSDVPEEVTILCQEIVEG